MQGEQEAAALGQRIRRRRHGPWGLKLSVKRRKPDEGKQGKRAGDKRLLMDIRLLGGMEQKDMRSAAGISRSTQFKVRGLPALPWPRGEFVLGPHS